MINNVLKYRRIREITIREREKEKNRERERKRKLQVYIFCEKCFPQKNL